MEKTRLFRDLGTDEVYTLENLQSQFEQLKAENPDDWEGWTFSDCLREWLRCSDLAEIFSYRVRYEYDCGKIHNVGMRNVMATSVNDAWYIAEELVYDNGADDVRCLEVTKA